MKKIIEGKSYNTETAQEIAWDSFVNPSDFNFWEETLYRTKKGNWFLHGRGGANSRYSQNLGGGSRGGGSDIIPMTESQAYEWLENHGKTEEIEQYFPDRVDEA